MIILLERLYDLSTRLANSTITDLHPVLSQQVSLVHGHIPLDVPYKKYILLQNFLRREPMKSITMEIEFTCLIILWLIQFPE